MGVRWKEAARLAFRGTRFAERGLDCDALNEVAQFQKMVDATAKELWRAANPGRERLPRRFEEQTRLYLRAITDGSTVVELAERVPYDEARLPLGAESTEVDRAVNLLQDVFRALAQDHLLPPEFPKSLIDDYERWGDSLKAGEEIEVIAPLGQRARVTPAIRGRLSQFANGTHEAPVDLRGHVLEADVRQGRFQLWPDDGTSVTVAFSESQEDDVTAALKGHRTLRMRVVGMGEFRASGEVLRVTRADALQLLAADDVGYDPDAKPIEEVIRELASQVPEDEWALLPDDLTDNLDHYLYGTPKG